MGYGFGPGMGKPVKKPAKEKPQAKAPVQQDPEPQQDRPNPFAPFPFDKIFGDNYKWKRK